MKVYDFELPADYIEYLQTLDDFDIYLESGAYLYLYPLVDLEQENDPEIVPIKTFFAIGNTGGDVGIFFSKKDNQIYSMPYTGMEEDDANFLARSFTEFIDKFKKSEIEII